MRQWLLAFSFVQFPGHLGISQMVLGNILVLCDKTLVMSTKFILLHFLYFSFESQNAI